MPRFAWFVGLVLLVGCDDSDPQPDAAGGADASVDASLIDAGDPDAALPDAAPPDASADAAPFTMSGEINLTTDTLTPGRVCAEAPQLVVSALTPSSATTAGELPTGCLVAGDEVLLVNLQGSALASVNVGQWELLEVASVDGELITFASAKQKSYGAEVGSDSGIGIEAGEQKVVLIRVPRYGALTLTSDAVVTATAWNGLTGGVVALRADSIHIDGSLTASRLGYRGGRWSQDSSDCTQNIQTENGESYTGPSTATTSRNGGGAGGIAEAEGPLFNANSPISASAGHASDGAPGLNDNGRTLGEPGAAYGAAGGARLTMGSGASGNLTCNFENSFPILSAPPNDHRAGGIVVVLAREVRVGESGTITATPVDAPRDTASSGGYVYLSGDQVDVGEGRVTAVGSRALSVNGPAVGMFNHGSVGYVAIVAGASSGTTNPPASGAP